MIHDAYLSNRSTGDNGCAPGDVVDGPVWLVVKLDSSAVPQPDGFRLGVLIGNARGDVAEAENVEGGTYRVALAPGKYVVYGFAVPDDGNTQRKYFQTSPARVVVQDVNVQASIELNAATSITLVTQSETGERIAGASVTLGYTDTVDSAASMLFFRWVFGHGFEQTLTTSADGVAHVPMLWPGIEYKVRAAKGWRKSDERTIVTQNGDNRLTVTLFDSSGGVIAKMVNEMDEALAGLAVPYSIASEAGTTIRLGEAESDSDGLVHIASSSGELVRLKVEGDYICPGAGRLLPPSPDVVRLTCYRAISFKIQVKYQDGSPCLGRIDVRSALMHLAFFPAASYSQLLDQGIKDVDLIAAFNTTGEVEVKRWPRAGTVNIGVEADKPGIRPVEIELDTSTINEGQTIVVQVDIGGTETITKGKLTLRRGGDLARDVVVTIMRESSRYVVRTLSLGEDVILSLKASRYIVYAASNETAWESPIIQLNAGDDRVVEIPRSPGGSVSATVLTVGGTALEGAVIEISTLETPRFPEAPVLGKVGLSDATGYVELGQQPVGRRQYRVEASGYQPLFIDAVVESSGRTQLGEIRLQKCTGEFRIRVLGKVEEGYNLTAQIMDSFSRRKNMDEVAVENGYVVFRDLVTERDYTVIVWSRSDARRPRSLLIRHVFLPSTAPVQEIEVSYSDLKE
jgi:hypothetical protein